MKFEIKPPFILFHDDKPGNHVTLSVDGLKAPFRVDASAFNDKKKTYAWAFEGTAREGDRVVFGTTDREVSGTVRDGAVVLEGSDDKVHHNAKPPKAVVSELPVETPPDISPSRSRTRPTPMPKKKK